MPQPDFKEKREIDAVCSECGHACTLSRPTNRRETKNMYVVSSTAWSGLVGSYLRVRSARFNKPTGGGAEAQIPGGSQAEIFGRPMKVLVGVTGEST